MPNFKFKKVKTLPTSGYSTGDIYFVSSEKKIYIRTESGWEDYGASGGVTSLGGKTGDILLDTGADGSTRIGFEIETVPVVTGGGTAKTLVGKLPAMKTINSKSLVGNGDMTLLTPRYIIPVRLLSAPNSGDINKANIETYLGYFAEDGISLPNKMVIPISVSVGGDYYSGMLFNGDGTYNGIYWYNKWIAFTLDNSFNLVSEYIATTGADNVFKGTNTFEKYTRFDEGLYVNNKTSGQAYYMAVDTNGKFWISNADDQDVEFTGVDTPTQDNAAANKKYVDDKVAAAGGGKSPLLIDLAELSGDVGTTMSLDTFNELVEAAKNSTPVFGYLENTESSKTTYVIVPLSVTHISSTSSGLSINYIRSNAAYNVGIMKRSDTECQIMVNSSRSLSLATSVSNASSIAVQSDAVWKAIHAEPLTVNTATSGVTSLTSSSNHKILCNVTSGTQQYNLPASPLDGETFMFLKVNSGHTLVIQSGTGNSNVFDCAAGTSNVTKTIGSTTKRKITVTYSSSVGKWFVMCDDFLS